MAGDLVRQTNIHLHRRGLQRRDFLCYVSAGAALGACGWPDQMAASAAKLRRQGKACILLWMQGGPSQFETFSPLPNHENGGETRAIKTSVPGIQIAENLPRVAQVMDDICILRSLNSKEGSHPRATYLWHTGYLPTANVRHPAFGSLAAEQLGNAAADLPSFVRIGKRFSNASGGGLLGVTYDPFVYQDPNGPPRNSQPTTDNRQFQRRLALLKRVEGGFAKYGQQETRDHKKLYEKSSQLVLTPDRKVFDIGNEPRSVREAYGESDFAVGCLMARRLVEQGVTFVEVQLNGWDTHDNNFERARNLCGQLDQPYAQLLRDLKQRGRLDNTMVMWMGEFGRTPRINPRGGRDHYPRAFNVALAGCGARGGQVIGATDAGGREVTEQPVSVTDFFRTVCHGLGMDADVENMGPGERPVRAVDHGKVVCELFG